MSTRPDHLTVYADRSTRMMTAEQVTNLAMALMAEEHGYIDEWSGTDEIRARWFQQALPARTRYIARAQTIAMALESVEGS